MRHLRFTSIFLTAILLLPLTASCQPEYTIFDDKMLLDGYAKKYADEPLETLLEMIKDDTLTSYMSAAAIRVFRERFSNQIFSNQKITAERILLRKINKADSSFVEIEAMHTLCLLDRYKYFKSMVPQLIYLIDHYNHAVNDLASQAVQDIIKSEQKRPREARIVYNTLRKMLFLSRKKYTNIKEPGPRLKQKLEILRWAIKILGSQELQRLPPEIIDFL